MSLKRNNEVETEAEETKAAPVAEVLEPETPDQEASVPATTTAAPPAVASSQVDMVSQLADAGFAGLEIDWTSFPTVVLNQGEFETSDGNSLGVDNFTIRIMNTRKRYVLRTKVLSDDEEPELAYTYDLAELDDPESELSLKVTKWKEEEDLDYDVKEYIEAIAMIEDADCSLNDQMVLVQIPPTSIGRFSGYMTQNALIKKQKPSDYLTRCFKGEKVTKAKKPFYPWAFEYVAG